MKKLIVLFVICFLSATCGKEDRTSGVCYCEFFKGDPQEYDLTAMTRQEQIDQCNIHDSNAAKFGGHCNLE